MIRAPFAVSLLLSAAFAAPAAEAPQANFKAFAALCAARSQDANAAGTMTVAGADGWLLLASELRHVSVGPFWGADAARVNRAGRTFPDPLEAIVDYAAQLKKLSIELIVLPVPPKAIIYADKLSAAVKTDAKGLPPRLDLAHQAFYKLLRDQGVNVLDLTDDFRTARADGGPQPFCKQDTHWSGRACAIAARRIAEAAKDAPWVKAIARTRYLARPSSVPITGDLWQDLKGPRPPKETLELRFIGTQGPAGLAPLELDPASPILLLGDSHTLVFHLGEDLHARGAGLADQLAYELGCRIERIGVRGSGARPARISLYRKQKDTPGYLSSKKLIVWCFAAREFTEAAWGKVPVTR